MVLETTKEFPKINPREFDSRSKRKIFSDEASLSVACDQNGAAWSFRIGYNGNHALFDQDGLFGMSAPFGGAVLLACRPLSSL